MTTSKHDTDSNTHVFYEPTGDPPWTENHSKGPAPVRLYMVRFDNGHVDIDGHMGCGGLRVEPGTEMGGPYPEPGSGVRVGDEAPWTIHYYPGWHVQVTHQPTGKTTYVALTRLSAMFRWQQEVYDAEQARRDAAALAPKPEPVVHPLAHLPPHLVPPKYVPPMGAPGITVRRESGLE